MCAETPHSLHGIWQNKTFYFARKKKLARKTRREVKQKFCHVTPGLPNNQFFLIISLLIFIFRSHSIIF